MTSDRPEREWEEREVYVSGTIDRDRQTRAESVLGQTSYWLLASRAYRHQGLRTYLVKILIREFAECLKYPNSGNAFLNAQILLWDAWSHVFMHLEDAAALLHATGEFGKQWDTAGKGCHSDLIYERYLSFSDPAAGSGASPQSVLEKIASSFSDARRALWLPAKKEWREMFSGASDKAYVPIVQTAENQRRVTREILSYLRSESGRKWYESYLRFKHGMPMVALDLFHTRATMYYLPGQVPDEQTTRADAAREVRRMRILMAHDPRGSGDDAPHLQSFDCNEKAAKQALGSSRLLSEIEEYVCKSIAHRAESEGAREFFIIRRADGEKRGKGQAGCTS